MTASTWKFLKIALLLVVLGSLYFLATLMQRDRHQIRETPVVLTPNCAEKLARHGLVADKHYQSPYVFQQTGQRVKTRGYTDEDIRAIQRGCNIIDDTQGEMAREPGRERWYATRFIRGNQVSCDHCHQGVGDKQDAAGNRLKGSLGLGASWVMADMYDRFTGLLLPFELRQMQCYINSSNGYKPNIADDVVRDVTAYTRFLSAALGLKIGNNYVEQGVDEIPASDTPKQGDDYVRGEALYKAKCASCHGPQGLGLVVDGRVIAPAVAGPNAWNKQSRNYFYYVSTILPGFICRNMPLGQENTLTNQECRDIGFFISNLPRPAGDLQGPLVALQQQVLMRVMPALMRLMESHRQDGAGSAVAPADRVPVAGR